MIINSAKTDPNKILPIRYPWARQYYKAAIANNWTPEEVSMQKDVEQWKSTRVLSDAVFSGLSSVAVLLILLSDIVIDNQ